MKQDKTMPDHVGKAPYHLLLLFAVLCVAFFAHSYALNLDLNIASRGFSVLEVLQALGNPAGFERDFPGGARLTTAASPTIYIYFLGYHLGVNWMAMIYAMIVLEMCTLLLGARLLWASFLGAGDNWSSEQKRLLNIMFVWVAAFLLISSVQRVNIANFGFPFFHGQFYGFADGLRLAVLAFVLRRRWILGAVLFVACFAIHPIKAVIMAGFAVPIVVYDWRKIWNFRFVLAALIAGIGALIWSTLVLGNNATGVGVPLADFVAYTRTLQFHWYPFDSGLFGENHLRGASPFMALLLVMLLALAQEGWDPQLKRKLLLGFGAALGLTAFGLYVSAVPTSATLIRISFVRASNLVTLIAPIIIVAGIFFAWRNHDRVLASGFFAFLCTAFSPSVEKTTLSAGFALVLFVIHARRGKTTPLLVTTALLVGGSLAWFAVKHTGFESAIVGVLPATLILLLLLLMFKAIDRFNPAASYGYGAAVVFTLCVFVGGLNYGVERTKWVTNSADFHRAYKETQIWANTQTANTALFMVDPCRGYGWRDFSGRASLGTVREWYMTAWIYSDRGDLLKRGHEIAQTLGFDMEPFRNAPGSNRSICAAARSAYYDPTLEPQVRLADKYGVNYFVFEKQFAADFPSELQARADFQNEHFLVISAERLK